MEDVAIGWLMGTTTKQQQNMEDVAIGCRAMIALAFTALTQCFRLMHYDH